MYKFNFTKNNGANIIQLSEIELLHNTNPKPECTPVRIEVKTDKWGAEDKNRWSLHKDNENGEIVMERSELGKNNEVTEKSCLEKGTYHFKFMDDYGDGICCQ